MRQLSLISLTRTEEELVSVEETTRAELIDLMARLLVIVLQNQARRTDERTSFPSQDQAGTPGA